jgi:hypothetical protein
MGKFTIFQRDKRKPNLAPNKKADRNYRPWLETLMRLQRLQFLNLRHLPARLTAEEAGWFLGFRAHQIPILVGVGMLKPLGQPASNAVKYFATATLCELKQDVNWQSRASKEIMQYWQKKNQKKGERA